MKLYTFALFALVGCGGAPFSAGQQELYDIMLPDSGTSEASVGDDAAPDAGQDGPVVGDAGQDAPDVREAATDAPAGDSGIQEQDSGGSQDSGQPDSGSGSGDAGLTCPGDLACGNFDSWPHGFCLLKQSTTGNLDFASPRRATRAARTRARAFLPLPYVPSPTRAAPARWSAAPCRLFARNASVRRPPGLRHSHELYRRPDRAFRDPRDA